MSKQLLTPVKRLENEVTGGKTRPVWLFKCECGGFRKGRLDKFKEGRFKSCGCMVNSNFNLKEDGRSKHYLYSTWNKMLSRCGDKNNDNYHYYGARGISVCIEWRNNFWIFVTDMGDRGIGLTLDRIDNDKGYCKENCRWADSITQANNRRKRRVKGEVS